jgi:hypothetical protein
MNLRFIVRTILEDYALPWPGTHGVGHWARGVGERAAAGRGDRGQRQCRPTVRFHDSKKEICVYE